MTTIKRIALLLIITILLTPRLVPGQSKYVKAYKPIADSLAKVYGIPVALILSIAIVESGSGTSRNAKLLNNHFGITGKNNLRKKRGLKSRYKQYADAKNSYTHFVHHLTKRKFYGRLKGNMNYVLWVDALSKDGYSERPAVWKHRVLTTIKKNRLNSTR
jgi:Bax protein